MAATFAALLRLDESDGEAVHRELDEVLHSVELAQPLFETALSDLASRLETAHLALGVAQESPIDAVQQKLLTALRVEVAAEVERLEADVERGAKERAVMSKELSDALESERYAAGALDAVRSSLSWRATAPVRGVLALVSGGLRRARDVKRVVTPERVRAAFRLIRSGKFREAWHQARSVASLELRQREVEPGPEGFEIPSPADLYEVHCRNNRLTSRRRRWLVDRLAAQAGNLPRVSIVVPVYEPPMEFLELAVASVLAQVHDDWELVLCDDASPTPDVAVALERIAARDSRIRVISRPHNGGIAQATNSAVAGSAGELLLFLDQDDVLAADAVAEVALAAAEDGAELVYSDDDKIDPAGNRYAPQFKPDFSPDLLLAFSYFSHVFAVRRSLFDEVGGVRAGFDGSQDFDLMLRTAERANSVAHVPRVLYHWRAHGNSTAVDGRAKSSSFDAGRRAVADAWRRRGADVPIDVPRWAQDLGCGIYEPRFADSGPRVTILIPSRDRVEHLRRCVESVERMTTYTDYEIVLIDNESEDPATVRYLATTPHRVLRIDNPRAGTAGFSYAAINNRAVEQVDCEFVLLLNNDTEVREERWLSQMVGYAGLAGVGAVGARLLLPDGRVQHAGILQGLYEGMAGPAFKLMPDWDGGHMSLARVSRNCAAVTAAVMLVRRATFLELGGFDEDRYPVAYNDVDFCHRLRAAGRRIVYCAGAVLSHVEGGSRGTGCDRPAEEASFRESYWRERDPFYNPNLSLDDERYEIRSAATAIDPGRPIRCVMVGFNLNAEGASNSQFELAVALRARGVLDPVVFSPTDGPLRAEYERHGIEVVVETHPMTHVHDPAFLAERTTQFARRLRELGAEIIYANTLQSFYAVLSAESAGLPAVWNVRESEPWRHYFDFLAPPLRPLALRAFAVAYATVFVSGTTMRGFEELNADKSFRLIRNGLDPARTEARLGGATRTEARAAYGFDEREVVLLALGTVCERKGQIDVVEAFGKVGDEVAQRSRLLIVGDRPSGYSEKMHDAIAALPRERRARVIVEDERDDVGVPYRAADVFVMSSRLESYPRVILEAMHVGLPIVSTPVFGVTEQVREDANALLYEPGDASGLARHLERLVADDAMRASFGRHSRDVLAALPGFEQMVDGYAEVLREAWSTGEDD